MKVYVGISITGKNYIYSSPQHPRKQPAHPRIRTSCAAAGSSLSPPFSAVPAAPSTNTPFDAFATPASMSVAVAATAAVAFSPSSASAAASSVAYRVKHTTRDQCKMRQRATDRSNDGASERSIQLTNQPNQSIAGFSKITCLSPPDGSAARHRSSNIPHRSQLVGSMLLLCM